MTLYTTKSPEIQFRSIPPSLVPCQKAELASVLRKPQVIFHLSMCGIFHALVMPATTFIVWAGSTNDEWVINLAHDVTDLAPARQRCWGTKRMTISRKWIFPLSLEPALLAIKALDTGLCCVAKENGQLC